MTLPGNGTIKRIVACVVGGIILFMAGAVLANRNDITGLNVEVRSVDNATRLNRDQMEKNRAEILLLIERNRTENRDEHRVIMDELKGIARDVKK